MLTTDDHLSLGEYAFKSSPESCSNSSNSFSTDYMDVIEEDFLAQLSSDLNIPLLLNPGEDELNMLNSFFDSSSDDILSEISSPASLRDEKEDLHDLQQLDLMKCGSDAFPNLKNDEHVDIKVEKIDSLDSFPKPSPTFCMEVKDEKPPLLNGANTVNNVVFAQPIHMLQQKQRTVTKIPAKRVPIQPKSPYTIPPSKTNQVVVINGSTPISKPPSSNGKVVVLENIRAVPVNNSIFTAQNCSAISPVLIEKNLPMGMDSIDPKAFKRQQRKIKNRESACLSRKKKKDYLTSLEEKVKELSDENQRLKDENQQLKARLSQHELYPKVKTSKNVKSIALCLFIFAMGINMDLLRNPFINKTQLNIHRNPPKLADHHSRNLLWTEDTSSEEIKNKTSNFSPLTMCPATINQTESARLVLELERWIGAPVSEPKNATNATNGRLTRYNHVRRRKLKIDTTLQQYKAKKRLQLSNVNNELQIFAPTPEQLYSDFFEAINRRDDTFYVVSFSDHHMLLPALHHNKTRRPKMSLIMPTVLPNGTFSQTNKVKLMQIDCEVLDTRLFDINYGSIPVHLRTTHNYTNEERRPAETRTEHVKASNGTNSTDGLTKKFYKPYFIDESGLKPYD